MKLTRITRVLVGATLAISLAVSANAAFTKTNTYAQGTFTDVKSDAWYAAEVASAYELGFMNGVSDTTFSPDGSVTVAEGITMASRVNAINSGKTIADTKGANWYDMYVAYAKENGIIKDGQFDSYTRAIKRFEMATLFYDAMPEGYYTAQNNVTAVPDVAANAEYAKKLLTLYNAGIVMGSDDYGTFYPNNNIKRSECAAIINRVAIPANRLKGSLLVNVKEDAYTLCYNTSFGGSKEGINSGWVYDNRGGPIKTTNTGTGILADISTEEGTALIREFNLMTSGRIVTETAITTTGDGVYMEFRDKDAKSTYQLKMLDKSWKILKADGSYETILENAQNKASVNFRFRIVTDLNAKTSTTYINDKNCGTYELLSDNILNFRFATDEEHTTSASPGAVNMVVNYAEYDDFTNFGTAAAYGWTTTGEIITRTKELVLKGSATAKNTFTPVNGLVCAETYFIIPDGQNFSYTLMSGASDVVKVEAKNGKLVSGGKEMYTLTKNMWYRLRIEADVNAGSADILLNGRKVGDVKLTTAAAVDSFAIVNEAGDTRFDYMKVYELVDHADYVPEPSTKASFDDYTVGLNICSLWRNGTHFGWACITPYDEPQPVLGYYDEGNPETADWEIKYMVEHGIDFQAFCWYPETSNQPLKDPRNGEQLYNGYMYAKYSDYMKYCLIWEAANSSHFKSEQFRNNVIPYWFENFFMDDRYLTIDNKLVLCVFGASKFADADYFGSVEGAKAEFDYLREEAKKHGFDGVIMLSCGSSSDTLANMGFDGAYAYNWGTAGNSVSTNTNGILNSAKVTSMYTVPTISVGFDSIPWHGSRYGNMTVADYKTAHEWVKNEYLPKYSTSGSWNDKLVMLSTWNEYGEGTYICPAGLNGFGYVDVIREEYTNLAKDHTDVIPDAVQKERINHMYAQYARLLRKEGWYKEVEDNSVLEPVKTILYTNETVTGTNMDNMTFGEDGLSGKSKTDNKDPLIITKEAVDINCDELKTLRITMKAPKDSYVEVFFTTEDDTAWTQGKSFGFKTTSDDMTSYVVKVTNGAWTGKLRQLRVDPVNEYDLAFTVKSVEFLSVKASAKSSLTVNDIEIKSTIPAIIGDDGDVYHPFDPTTAVNYILNVHYEWRKDAKTLTIFGNHKTFVYTVGSDKYTVDGAEKSLGYTLTTRDGLPMLSFTKLAKDLGYTVTKDGNNIAIKTSQYDLFNKTNNRPEADWEFNDFDSEGWVSNFFSLIVNGGTLQATSISDSQDPTMTLSPVALDTKKYNAIEIKVRYAYDNTNHSKQSATMYFITNKDSSWNETKTIRFPLASMDTEGEWETIKVDLTENPAWLNTVTSLRFDPFNAIGNMEFDYIKFIENPDYVYVAPEDMPFAISNGDAEQTSNVAFSTNNATITIVEDSEKKGNHVYNVAAKPGKNWSYFRQDTTFKAGKTYKIEYDIRVTGDNSGATTGVTGSINCNMRYPETGALNNFDHLVKGTTPITYEDGWVHVSLTWTVEKMDGIDGHQFTLYSNPNGENSVSFQVDNIVVTETDAVKE